MARSAKPKKPKVPAYPCRDLYSKVLEARLGEECWAEWQFCKERKWRLDYSFPEWKVGIEIDGGLWTGGRHSGGIGQKRDLEKMNAAAELGWLVLHYTPEERMKSDTMMQIFRTIQQRKEHARNGGFAGLPRGIEKGEGEQEGGIGQLQ